MKDSICNKRKYGQALLIFLFWMALWQLLYVIVGREYIIPAPLHTLSLVGKMAATRGFYADAAWTIGRVICGMALSFVLGSLCAVAAHFLPALRRLLTGPVTALKSTPVMSVILLAILAFPTDGVPVFVCFLMCYPVVYTNLLAGMDSVDRDLVELCQVYEINGKRRFLALYRPTLRPFVKAALTLIAGLSWKTVVAAEVFAVPRYSMGYHLLTAKAVLEADALFAWTIAIVLLSFAFETLVKALIAREWNAGVSGAFVKAERRAAQAEAGCADAQSRNGRCSNVPNCGGVEFCGVSKSFEQLELYRDFSLTLPAGETTAIVGASGCGKTTLLRMAAGLALPDGGTVVRRDEPVRRVSCVFQEDRLFPWMTVRENLRLVAGEDVASQMLSLMGLSEFGDYLPGQLSGGMCRRVAIGRALAYDSAILLMDEPFTGLDEELKRQLCPKIRALWRRRGCTVMLITHDRSDADILADHVFQLAERPVCLRKLK